MTLLRKAFEKFLMAYIIFKDLDGSFTTAGPNLKYVLQAWMDIEDFRELPKSRFQITRAHDIFEKYVLFGAKKSVRFVLDLNASSFYLLI